MDCRYFIHPSTILISGPTGSGKTRFVQRLITNKMIQPWPIEIKWIYGEWQGAYEELLKTNNIEFIQGWSEEIYDRFKEASSIPSLLILDDVMTSARDSKSLSRLFTRGSHHRNLTVIYIVQNLFDQGKSMRTVSLNSQYMVLFKNPRDVSQITTLATQIFPKNSKVLGDIFKEATIEPFGYLILDFRPETKIECRYKTAIFPGDSFRSYVPIIK